MKTNKIVTNYIYNTLYQILLLIAPLITTPYISRVLGVTNIGIYQYSQSVATYFVLIGAVGTTLYGQREIAWLQHKPDERTHAFWEIEIFRFCTSLICTVTYFATYGSHGQHAEIASLLTLEVFATAFDISWFFMGLENFGLTVRRNTIIKLTGILCVFLFVKSRNDLWVYTLCVTAPILLGNCSLWFSLRKYLTRIELTPHLLIRGIGRRICPILLLFLPQVAMDVYLVLDKTMLGLLASSIDQVGYYSQAQKIVQIVLKIATSLGTVMLPAMSAAYAKGDFEGIRRSLGTAFHFIYMLSFALMFGLCAVAPRFVPMFFGKGYVPVASLMVMISPILVIIATSNVLGKQYLLPTNRQKQFTISIIVGAAVNFALNYLLIPRYEAVGATIATVVAEMAVTFVQCVVVRRQLPLKEYLKPFVKYLICGLVMFLAVRGLGLLLPRGSLISIALMVLFGIAVYGLELLLTKDENLLLAKRLIHRS